MKKLGRWFEVAWYPTLLLAAGVGVVGGLLWFELGSLVAGHGQTETARAAAGSSLQAIIDNPLNFPHKVLQLGFMQLKLEAVEAARAASAVVGFVVAAAFFYILRNWYSRRVATLGTALFVCSAWFLHNSRFGTEGIMYSLLIAVVACVIWMQKPRSGAPAVIATSMLLVALLYMPGMIWIILPVFFWQLGRITRLIQDQNAIVLTLMLFSILALLAPLGWALYRNTNLIWAYAGLPQTFAPPVEILKNIASVPLQLFFRGPDNPEMWLGRLALIDWFGTVMFIIGASAYFTNWRLDRTGLVAAVFVAGLLLVGIGGPVTIALLLPFVYLVITAGIAWMLQEWFRVFPRNPVARTTGAVLMSLAVLMSAYYNINHYFIAWPNTPETKEVFTSRQ